MAVDDSISTELRFFNKVLKTDSCWQWLGHKNRSGYGTFYFSRIKGYAHRYSHIRFVGPIPDGCEVDHICRNSSCVSPNHLRAIPVSQNRYKGTHRQIDICKNGHPYEALFIGKNRQRACRICKNLRLKAWRKSAREGVRLR